MHFTQDQKWCEYKCRTIHIRN